MAETVDLIKEKLDVADVIQQYVALTPAGKNLKGLCPFHKEKTPSFIVSPDRQMWHCFGCNSGGDIITFLMKYENLEFIEALKILADKAGVDLKISGNQDQRKFNALYDINRLAKDYFVAALKAEPAKETREYLSKRGLKAETIDEFEIGLSGTQSDGLIKFLVKRGFSVDEIKNAGLAVKTDRGTYRDWFTARVMFPLYNTAGKIVGFTGRILPWNDTGEVGKYVNSPETPIFNKSKLLFGFSKSKQFIRDLNQVVLLEGQMDLIMAWQDGVRNAVATSGTALTPDHLKVLRRLTENLILAFDNDNAGKAASERTIDLAQTADFNVKVLMISDPTLKDAADIVLAKPRYLKELITGAVPAMEYYLQYYGVNRNQPIAEKKKSVRQTLSKIKSIASAVEQSHWLTELSTRSGVPESALMKELAMVKTELGKSAFEEVADTQTPMSLSRPQVISQRLLSLVLQDEHCKEKVLAAKDVLSESYAQILDYLSQNTHEPLAGSLQPQMDLIYLASSLDSGSEEARAKECDQLISALQQEGLKDRRKQLMEEIRALEASKDETALAAKLKEYRDLTSS